MIQNVSLSVYLLHQKANLMDSQKWASVPSFVIYLQFRLDEQINIGKLLHRNIYEDNKAEKQILTWFLQL